MATVKFDAYALATGFKIPSGTSQGFLKADGSVDIADYIVLGDITKSFIDNLGINATHLGGELPAFYYPASNPNGYTGDQDLSNVAFTNTVNTFTKSNYFSGDVIIGNSSKIIQNVVSTRDKYRVWSSNEYTIGMGDGYSFGAINSNFAMTFQMNNDANRGFWWGDTSHLNSQGAMSLSTTGKLTLAHSIRVGYGETDTTIPGLVYKLDVNGTLYSSSVHSGGDVKLNENVRFGGYAGDDARINYFGNSFYWDNFHGAYYFRTSSSYTTRLSILGNGNVGIGTTSPEYKLHIKETSIDAKMYINGENATNSSSLLIGRDARNWEVKADTAANLYTLSVSYIGTDEPVSNILTLTKDGNVGIGTATPLGKFSVQGGSSVLADYKTYSNGGESTNMFALESSIQDSPYNYARVVDFIAYSDENNGGNRPSIFRFMAQKESPTNPVEIMRIGDSEGNGNVGIGKTDPAHKLHVEGDLRLGNSNNASVPVTQLLYQGGATSQAHVSLTHNWTEREMQWALNSDYGGAFDDFVWKTRTASGGITEKMRITNEGKVGIGTNSPSEKLEVNGYIKAGRISTVTSTPNFVAKSNSASTIFDFQRTDNTQPVKLEYSGTGVLTFTTGTITYEMSRSTGFTVNNKITASSFLESSLRELKTNIKPFNKSGLDLVNELNIVEYNKKDNLDVDKVGIIIDESPNEFANKEQTAVDLYKTIFVQAKAIQELSDKNTELEARLTKLEKLLTNG